MMTLAIVLLVCVASVFALSACNFDKLIEDLENADYTENYDSANKEGSVELINAFFEETLKDPDFVVTCKNKDGEVQYTETVKGTDGYTLGKDGTKVYAYKKGDAFYVAIISQEEDDEGNTQEQRYYYCSDSSKPGYYADSESGTMEDLYKGNYCTFMSKVNGVNIVELLPEDKGTYSCKTHGEKKDGVTTGSLEFSFTADEGSITITASSEENKVKTLTVSVSDGNTLTWTFVYGNASVELPDTDAWDREAAAEAKRREDNRKAIEARDDFFAETTCASNVVVTVDVGGKQSYVQSILNGMECLDFGTHKVYTFMKDVDDETTDAYYVFDGEEKYYMVNDDAFDSVVMYYYHMGICLYDALGEQGASFSCEIEGDSLTFGIAVDGENVATLVATKSGDTVSSAALTAQGEDGAVTTTYTFEYGSASLEEPHLSDYQFVCNSIDLSDFEYSYVDGKITINGLENEELTSLVIPEGVEAISDFAFYEKSTLTSVVLPDSLTEIGALAFGDCTALSELTLSKNLVFIGDSAFFGCSSLTQFVIPSTVEHIGDDAFSGCDHLQYNSYEDGLYLGSDTQPYLVFVKPTSTNVTSFAVNENTKYIHGDAFKDCQSLTNVELPQGLESIQTAAFSGCASLANVTIPQSVSFIGSYAFRDCVALTSIKIPDGIESLSLGLFERCVKLESVTIPSSVKDIGLYVFYGTAIEDIVLPTNLEHIGDGAFSGCTALKSIEIPSNVNRIGFGAFSGCVLLENVVIPDAVERIWFETFEGCTALKTVSIPSSVTNIGDDAFKNCTQLTAIAFAGTVEQWDGIEKKATWNANTGDYTIQCSDGNIAK